MAARCQVWKMHGCKVSSGLLLPREEKRVRWLKKNPVVTRFTILQEEDSLLACSSGFYTYLFIIFFLRKKKHFEPLHSSRIFFYSYLSKSLYKRI
jgi:hypothetical protein